MDRNIVYPGSIPLDTDLLATNRNAMVALGALMRAVLGTGAVVDGLAVTPSVPASMNVLVGPGSITQLASVDAAAYGSLAADPASALVKMGTNLAATSFALAAPTTSGQSVTSLIEAAFQEADVDPVVLPYYNAANPAMPYLGPGNSGVAQNTRRVQRVQLQLKPGVPATTGTQVAPAVDSGWVGLATVTVAYGQTTVTAPNIAPLFTAPTLAFRLPELRPGFATMQAFTADTSFVVPPGVTRLRVRAIGGGGGGGGNTASGGGGGGGGGGYAEGVFAVGPGQVIAVGVGAGGAAGSNASGSAAGNSGGNGGASSFGTFLSAAGGSGGQGSLAGGQGNSGPGGVGSGGSVNMGGAAGNAGFSAGSAGYGGHGGSAAAGGGGGAASSGLPSPGAVPGGGGAGGGGNFAGAAGAAGLVIVEY
ncbi:MAG: hypothetical protein IT555_05765 [Acetobacteraceae bacterium]|nr:hypothetical protein [Acetobacteraceae bacterium]